MRNHPVYTRGVDNGRYSSQPHIWPRQNSCEVNLFLYVWARASEGFPTNLKFSLHLQGSAKRWALVRVNSPPAAKGSPEVGFTQPRAHCIADPCTLSPSLQRSSHTFSNFLSTFRYDRTFFNTQKNVARRARVCVTSSVLAHYEDRGNFSVRGTQWNAQSASEEDFPMPDELWR